jgi:hypothetical protein
MLQVGVSLALLTFCLPLCSAREQQVFSLGSSRTQKILPHHHQPWSLLLSRDTYSSNCIILHPPELTQIHRSISKPGDVLVIDKSPSSAEGIDGVTDHTYEIIGFDKRLLWSKTSELCSLIDYQYFSEDKPLAEYEVVCS